VAARDHGLQPRARRHPPAIADTGTRDIGVIVQRYRGNAFGFASRNFYAEFLAALDVDKHREHYFGKLEGHVAEPTRVIPLERPLGIEVAAKLAGCERDTVVALNPALMDCVVDGRRHIPSGYALASRRSIQPASRSGSPSSPPSSA
jgi:membrane-bound lytic murein transglycosylase D